MFSKKNQFLSRDCMLIFSFPVKFPLVYPNAPPEAVVSLYLQSGGAARLRRPPGVDLREALGGVGKPFIQRLLMSIMMMWNLFVLYFCGLQPANKGHLGSRYIQFVSCPFRLRSLAENVFLSWWALLLGRGATRNAEYDYNTELSQLITKT